MARAQRCEPVAVAMTGGHGEWFVAGYATDASQTRPLVSLTPAAAITVSREPLVAGSQAGALVAARGFGEALPIWPDARALPVLPKAALTDEVHPLYGRAPDARLPQGAA
jgi:hypothetical protein